MKSHVASQSQSFYSPSLFFVPCLSIVYSEHSSTVDDSWLAVYYECRPFWPQLNCIPLWLSPPFYSVFFLYLSTLVHSLCKYYHFTLLLCLWLASVLSFCMSSLFFVGIKKTKHTCCARLRSSFIYAFTNGRPVCLVHWSLDNMPSCTDGIVILK